MECSDKPIVQSIIKISQYLLLKPVFLMYILFFFYPYNNYIDYHNVLL